MTDGTNPVIEPCPFCGSAAAVGEAEDHLGTIWPTVSCGTCPAEVTGHTEAKAIAAWNALAAPPAPSAKGVQNVSPKPLSKPCQMK
jgi:Lar family restriction alleviation protein